MYPLFHSFFTVYPSAKFPIPFETVAFIVNLWLVLKAHTKKELLFPLGISNPICTSLDPWKQHWHEVRNCKDVVPETWLSWDAGIRLHAACHRQWLSVQMRWHLHSGESFIHLSPLYLACQAPRVGGLDRADSSSAFNWRRNWLAHLAKQGN